MRAIQALCVLAAGAALWLSPIPVSMGAARAATLVIGGLGGACYQAAKAGRADDDALAICTQALSDPPLELHALAGTYVNRGAMFARRHDWDRAHQDFLAALKVDPRLGEAHVGLGVYLIHLSQFAPAEAEISRGLALKPEEPEKAYYFRAIARWGQDDFRGAYFDFLKAIALKPDWQLPRAQLAYFHVSPAPSSP